MLPAETAPQAPATNRGHDDRGNTMTADTMTADTMTADTMIEDTMMSRYRAVKFPREPRRRGCGP